MAKPTGRPTGGLRKMAKGMEKITTQEISLRADTISSFGKAAFAKALAESKKLHPKATPFEQLLNARAQLFATARAIRPNFGSTKLEPART